MYVRDYIVTFRDKYKRELDKVIVKDTVWYKVQKEAEKLVSEDVKNSYASIAMLPINGGENS